MSDLLWPMLTAFALLVGAGIGLPFPEELPTVGAGIWVGSQPELGPLRWLILPVCFAGVILSDVMLYAIGRFWGTRLLQHRWLARLFPADKRAKIEQNFQHYGIRVLLFIRWIPAIRSPMFITAGLMRVPALYFVLIDGLAAVLGHSLLFFLAYVFGDQFQAMIVRAEHTLDTAVKPLLILVAIGAVGLFFLIHFLRRPISTGDPAQELPLIGPQVAARIEHSNDERTSRAEDAGPKEAAGDAPTAPRPSAAKEP